MSNPNILRSKEAPLAHMMEPSLEVRRSQLYYGGRGVFATRTIPAGVKVAQAYDDIAITINDGSINIINFYAARNSVDMYTFWINMYKNYNTHAESCNVNMTAYQNKIYLVSTKPILSGKELLRPYGFPVWIHILFPRLRNETVAGAMVFLVTYPIDDNHPWCHYVNLLRSVINTFASQYNIPLSVDNIETAEERISAMTEDNVAELIFYAYGLLREK
jgi:hypothetical protein